MGLNNLELRIPANVGEELRSKVMVGKAMGEVAGKKCVAQKVIRCKVFSGS
jgi:hypothetical protein